MEMCFKGEKMIILSLQRLVPSVHGKGPFPFILIPGSHRKRMRLAILDPLDSHCLQNKIPPVFSGVPGPARSAPRPLS